MQNEGKISKPERQYLNSSDLINELWELSTQIMGNPVKIKILPQKNVLTTVDVTMDKNVCISGPVAFTPEHAAVIDSCYTILKSGYKSFPEQLIAKVMSGNFEPSVSQEKLEHVHQLVSELRHMDVTIDCTDEFRERGFISKKEKMKFKNYMLPLLEVEMKTANGVIVRGYKFIAAPPLCAYAETIHKIIDVPFSLLSTCKKVSDTKEAIIIKRYLIQKIERAKEENHKDRILCCQILYESSDRSKSQDKGMYYSLGYKEESYSNWRKKRSRLNAIVKQVLESFREQGYISEFQEFKNGQKIVGVQITIKRVEEKTVAYQ